MTSRFEGAVTTLLPGRRVLLATGAAAVAVAIVAAGVSRGSVIAVVGAPIALLVAVVAVWLGLRHPLVALGYFLFALFLRLALPRILPVDPFLPAFVGLLLSTAIWGWANRERLPRPGVVELVMAIYLGYNVVSTVLPHEYGAGAFIPTAEPINLFRMILSSTAMPFALYFVGRTIGNDARRARVVMWFMVAIGAYSTLVSIGQFHAPGLVWPRYIVSDPNWVGRANGVPNQPVVNGIIILLGFICAMYLASRPESGRAARVIAGVVAATSVYAVFLTHTRIIYLALVLVLVVAAVIARGYRTGFVLIGALGAAAVVANWSTFTSSDRAKGGVGSTSEVLDRLNTAATSFWGFQEKPVFGWGLGRFISLNTLHHQQWTPSTPFDRGLGIAPHFNELGILSDLGIVGLVLWLAVLAGLIVHLVIAYRAVPSDALTDSDRTRRAVVVTAILGLLVMVTAGTSVDLRLFDLPVVATLLLVGLAVGAAERQRRPRHPSLPEVTATPSREEVPA
ncbi:O-antigen ligase family protein [Williamsia deligens]|uniref:O-antigen ligase family protein n=1 Tax=Williamsia deligens TaxID=321325 RepID=A0ABW3G3K9_9NOCA|nr:O-antigen ligase family protein [Williamsia deligens]MCP2194174.1 O-antigen ligase [Williamsia deligens]